MLHSNPLKILVLSSFDGRNANVIRDFLFSFNAYSIHDYYYIFDCSILDESMDFSLFDVVLIFWSLYLPGNELSQRARDKICQSRALKILFLQDEYRDVRLFNRLMSQLGIQIMFTCVAENDHEIFYPKHLIPTLQATYTVLTGYVPSYLEKYSFEFQYDRPLDIVYRSRVVPFYLGDLGREKKIIADRFHEVAREYGFKSDISVRDQDRIYGKRWIKFLQSSRIALGTPSGASVIDFTGEIRRNCEKYLAQHPDASYEEVKEKFFAEQDGKVVIDTVSPRIFEAVALGCTLVMHEGYYGGILQAGKHYIAIKKDYSNLDEVLAQMRDEPYCRQISHYAYRDLVSSGEFSYQTFIRKFDQILSMHVRQSQPGRLISKSAFYAKNYFKHGQTIIPNREKFSILPFDPIFRGLKWANKISRKLFTIMTVPEASWLLFLYFSRWIWISLKPSAVLADVLKIALLIHLKAHKFKTRDDFYIEASFEPAAGSLILKSCPAKESNASFSLKVTFPVSTLEMALKQGKLNLFEWDHSSIDNHIFIERDGREQEIYMDLGRHLFKSIPVFARHFPTQTWAALSRIFVLE